MFSKSEAVCLSLLGIGQTFKKNYCFPSQEKILDVTKEFYKVRMSRRTLNRVLKKLVDEGMIERIRRHRKGSLGQMIFCSTLYKFKGKLFNWLYSLAKRLRNFFSFYRVPKWAQYKPKKELKVSFSTPPSRSPPTLEKEKGGPTAIKDILEGLTPHF